MNTTTRTPRVIDPAIAALRKEHAEKVAELKRNQQSAATLKTITEKLLPKLNATDAQILRAAINGVLNPDQEETTT